MTQVKESKQIARGVLPEKVGGNGQPASQNPYPIYDQNLRYSLSYLWLDQPYIYVTWTLHQSDDPVSDPCYNKFPSSN